MNENQTHFDIAGCDRVINFNVLCYTVLNSLKDTAAIVKQIYLNKNVV